MNTLIISLTVTGMTVASPVITVMSLPPAGDGLVLVIAPPWADRDTAIAAAGGRGIGVTVSPLASLAYAEDPAFGDRIRAAGPYIVADGKAVATLCGVSE